MLWLLAILVSISAVSCASAPDPNTIELRIVETGLFAIPEAGSSDPLHLDTTSSIECRFGAAFGTRYEIIAPTGSHGRVKLDVVWRHPHIVNPKYGIDGTQTKIPHVADLTPDGRTGFIDLWTILGPEDRVEGEYELRVGIDDRLLLSQPFFLHGC